MFRLLTLGFAIFADLFHRRLPSAQYAAGTSRTRQSRHAVMSSAKIASKNVSPRDRASVRIATNPLEIMTTCTSPSDYSPVPRSLFSLPSDLCAFSTLEDFNFLYHSLFFGFFPFSFPNICRDYLFTPWHFLYYGFLFEFLFIALHYGKLTVVFVWFLAGQGS